MNERQQETAFKTYFGLRLGLIALAGMLFVSVFAQRYLAGCVRGSLSAYYYTASGPVFVAALSAIGAALVVYRGGSDAENSILDVAGFLAFVVAFVPTRYTADSGQCAFEPPPDQLTSGIVNNMASLFVTGLGALVLARLLKPSYVRTHRLMSRSRTVSVVVAVVLLSVGIAWFAVLPELFRRWAHGTAAVGFFLLVLAVMLLNARRAEQPYGRLYVITAVTAAAAAAVAFLFRSVVDEVFWAEVAGIAGFAVFWMVQTSELGGFTDADGGADAAGERRVVLESTI